MWMITKFTVMWLVDKSLSALLGGNFLNCTFNTYTCAAINIGVYFCQLRKQNYSCVITCTLWTLHILCYCTLDSTLIRTGGTWLASCWDETQLKVYIGQSLDFWTAMPLNRSLNGWTFTTCNPLLQFHYSMKSLKNWQIWSVNVSNKHSHFSAVHTLPDIYSFFFFKNFLVYRIFQ